MNEQQKEKLAEALKQKRIAEENYCSYIVNHLNVMCETAGCTRTEAAIMFLSESVSALTETVYDIFEQMEVVNGSLDDIKNKLQS